MGQEYTPSSSAKPGKLEAIAIMTLINGILNIIWSLTASLLIVVGTIGIGILCTPFTLAPLVLGIFEIIYGAQLMAKPPKRNKLSMAISILEMCCILLGNVVSLVVGILTMVFANDAEVQDYFARLNS